MHQPSTIPTPRIRVVVGERSQNRAKTNSPDWSKALKPPYNQLPNAPIVDCNHMTTEQFMEGRNA